MKPLFPTSSIASMLLAAGLLSACSPNPYVLQDRVYGSNRPAAPPVTQAPKPVVVAPAPVSRPSNTVSNKPQATPPEVADTAQTEAEVLVVPPKAYQSSPAVQALMKQADAEMGKGKLDNAATLIERALRIESDNPDLWMKLSTINERQGNHEQAVSMANKANTYRE